MYAILELTGKTAIVKERIIASDLTQCVCGREAMMDVAGLSTAMSATELQARVGTAVLGKVMDMNEELGQGLMQLMDTSAMERSVNPHLGANMDIRI